MNEKFINEYSLAPYRNSYLLTLKKATYTTDLVKVVAIIKDYKLSPIVSKKISLLKKGDKTYLTTQGKLDQRSQQQFNELNKYLDEYTEAKEQIPLF